mmetsp:Transcript_41720/g.90883  ORF Transcript_41720/g.90883 Transcript_41720/m.90883 type:complete len:83 (-) Transcript_41720:991-1239(-)
MFRTTQAKTRRKKTTAMLSSSQDPDEMPYQTQELEFQRQGPAKQMQHRPEPFRWQVLNREHPAVLQEHHQKLGSPEAGQSGG